MESPREREDLLREITEICGLDGAEALGDAEADALGDGDAEADALGDGDGVGITTDAVPSKTRAL
jgi:hypothetical protein